MPAISLALAAVGALNVSTDPTCDPIGGLGDVPGWLICQANVYSSLLVFLATAAVAWTAWEAHRREGRRADERREAAEARIRADAFDLISRLWHWKERSWPVDGTPDEKVAFARDLRSQFAGAMQLAKKMYEDTPDASDETAENVRAVYAKLTVTVNDLREVAEIETGSGFDIDPYEGGLLTNFSVYEEHVADCDTLLTRTGADLAEYL